MTDASNIDATISLPAVLDLAAAEGLLAMVRERVQGAQALRFDASGVETLTLPCIQIILSATRSHDQVSIESPSDAFVAAFADLGLDWGQGVAQRLAREPAQDLGRDLAQDCGPSQEQEPLPALSLEQVLEEAQAEAQEEAQALPEQPMPALLHGMPGPQPLGQPGEPPEEQVVGHGQALSVEQVLQQAQEQAEAAEPAPKPIPAPLQESASDETQERAPDEDRMDELSMAKKILTIDDSKTIRDMLMLTLADAGFEVIQAVDGQDGINVLGDQPVDVVITDINMPKMDGYAVIRHLRRSPVHKTTPILVLTTESDTEKKHLAREAGATGWMVKPFDPDRLVATIRRVSP